MRCPLRCVWRAKLLVWVGLLLRCAEARVNTEAQTGPLYRVLGTPLHISCNVSGFSSESAKQDFEFILKKTDSPEINIISTKNQAFSYAIYERRIQSNDVSVTHVNPTSVVFEIKNLLRDDEGEFICSVINSEYIYDGSYSASTAVKVIDDSLSVLSRHPTTPLSYHEGEALTLTCQASSNTVQHTHLSVTWYLRKDGEAEPQPIISLDKDFTLVPGPLFEQRYREGLIRLDKLGEATYRLSLAQLEQSDQGKIYCQAKEWIQDPDRSWYSIIQKDAEEIPLTVKAREVAPDLSSLVVKISTPQAALQEGQELAVSCSIDTLNLEGRFFSVAWLQGEIELARVGPTGILTVGPEYSGREKEGELRAVRTGTRDYQLILKPVRTDDQGQYVCRAWPQERDKDGVFTPGPAQDSDPQTVVISVAESSLSVKIQDSALSVIEGRSLKLACKVDRRQGLLSVTWQLKSAGGFPQADVISLSKDGVMERAPAFTSRKVRAMRPAADSFVLELDEVRPSDSGVYQCTVSEWKSDVKTHSQSQNASVTVNSVASLVKVSLKSRNSQVTVGDPVEMICQIRGPRMPLTVTWSVKQPDSAPETIVMLYSDGSISWFGNKHHYQVKVENQESAVVHYLQIVRASQREKGIYQCSVSAFLENIHKKLSPSNPLSVMVQNRESKLTLVASPAVTQNTNSDVQIKCSVTAASSASSAFAVSWLLRLGAASTTIMSSDRNALVTFGDQAEPNYRQRVSMRRAEGPNFELTIRQARISDSGLYECQVVEWLRDPHGDWYSLPVASATTSLAITEPTNDLLLDKKEKRLNAREGDEVELSCDIISGASGTSFFYKATWFYAPQTSPTINSSLVRLDHTGLLSYPENQALRGLQGRLRLTRPSQSSYRLRIQTAHEEDSGTYWCQVEQYQPNTEGRWQQKASESSGPTVLAVNVTDVQLSIRKEDVELNISNAEGFTIPCDISRQSSNESKFQVTWFWQRNTDSKKQPIFTAYRNSTFQAKLKEDSLRFGHALPRQFSLTMLKPGPENSGLYFCEVEEWLPSLTYGWRKVAMEQSGNLSVSVNTEGEVQLFRECTSGTWIVTVVILVIVSLLVITVLVIKIYRSKDSGEKKSGSSLWAEHPLTAKSSPED
ncbi:unnamed protein product [Menidia menidia]|uniref:(Atlantic silverside) hypothetical protein n=1 Tax=Menidia menidia TaxID=238744 RepID=A0A8S4AN99_9TELE|nr:unnamed protein product [Menidia menidia]